MKKSGIATAIGGSMRCARTKNTTWSFARMAKRESPKEASVASTSASAVEPSATTRLSRIDGSE